MGAEYAERADILIYLTQDAVLFGTDAFATLARAFEDAEVGAAYGQAASAGEGERDRGPCTAFQLSGERRAYARGRHGGRMGFKSIFFSNAFGAYRRSAL